MNCIGLTEKMATFGVAVITKEGFVELGLLKKHGFSPRQIAGEMGWARFRKGANPLYAFCTMPGFSRASHVEFVRNMKVPTLATCHERAFEAFGGVPRRVLYHLPQADIRTDSSSHAARTILTRKFSSAANSRSAAG